MPETNSAPHNRTPFNGQLLIGQTLQDRYRIINQLADDYWGSVYKAYDPKFDRTVAIQVLDPQLVQADSLLPQDRLDEHFLQLARTLLSWRHPGIARVYDFGQVKRPGMGSLSFMVREFVPGGNLRQLMKDMRDQDQWVSLSEAVQIVRQICLALDYAHQRRVEHGDLQPKNIFITEEATENLPYQPVLVNLGLTRAGLPVSEPSSTAYQSPEVKRGSRFEARADVYSAGVILYELATGQIPADAGGKSVVLETGSVLSILPPKILRSDIPDSLNKIIIKAMAFKPNERYESAGEMASALAKVSSQVRQVKSAPPGLARIATSGVTLLSIYRRSLNTPLYAEIDSLELQENLREPEQGSGDLAAKIHILEPNGNVRSVDFKPTGLTFGRASDNDVLIQHSSISRHHARIDFDGKNYQVRDLKSMNGTYLETTRLSPDTPQVWLPGENLRLGEVWLRLESPELSHSTKSARVSEETRPSQKDQLETAAVFLRPDGSPIDPAKMMLSSDGGWVGAFLEQPNISVTPGESVTATLLLFNRRPAADIFQIMVQGIPADWMPNQPQAINLPANGQVEVKLIFKPPRLARSRAGRHSINLRIASRNAPRETGQEQNVELRLSLTVAAFSQFNAELRPRQIDSRDTGQIVIDNQGNLPETFTLVWEDKNQELSFDPPQVRVVIPPGKSAAVEFNAALIQPRWFGGETAHAFTVHANSQAGQVQSPAGEFVSRGLIPAWAPIALVSLCVMLICILFLLFNQISAPSRLAQQTSQAGQTSIAAATIIASQDAAIVGTATVNAIGSNQGTIQAITATAQWLAADDDQDGLNNSLEIQAGTRPDVADTDEDGLNDGNEVNRWLTNPVIADSDGDGLKDGVEIEKGTNPLSKDTDGDGIEDAADPNPAQASTVTPSRTTEPTRTSTNTPTITPTNVPNIVDLTISINNGQASSIPGTITTYIIQVANKGPATANNAKVTSKFPNLISNVNWNCSATAGSQCLVNNGTGNIDVGVDLAANGTATFTAIGNLAPGATGLLIHQASVATPVGVSEANTVDNLAIDTDTLTPKVALSITKTDGRTSISPGESTSYTIEVTNSGPSTAPGINLTDIFPSELTNMSWTCIATAGSSCTAKNKQFGNINTTVNLLPSGSATIYANGNVKSNASGILSNTALMSSSIDPVNNNKNATDTTTLVPKADLELEVSAPVTVAVNTPIVYTISITNTGPSTANNLVLTDLLPELTTFVSSSPGSLTCTQIASQVTCNLGNLAPEATIDIEITVTAPANPGSITNQVSVLSDVNDPNPSNNLILTQVNVE